MISLRKYVMVSLNVIIKIITLLYSYMDKDGSTTVTSIGFTKKILGVYVLWSVSVIQEVTTYLAQNTLKHLIMECK